MAILTQIFTPMGVVYLLSIIASTIEKLRKEYAKIPGVATNIGGFISHRMDEVLSGVRSAIAVKIFGPDLEQLRAIGILH